MIYWIIIGVILFAVVLYGIPYVARVRDSMRDGDEHDLMNVEALRRVPDDIGTARLVLIAQSKHGPYRAKLYQARDGLWGAAYLRAESECFSGWIADGSRLAQAIVADLENAHRRARARTL